MDTANLAGTYTYRSFLDRPDPVDDFNRLRFAQLELRLTVDPDGSIGGALVFPTSPGEEPLAMHMTGKATNGTGVHFTLTGRGQPNSPISDFHYEYDGIVLPSWAAGINQRQVLAGTVLRAADHGSGDNVAPAGQTASFLAVKRDA
ncbi:hypothetical protein E2C00_17100 [Streptomyces sp. WAC05374]|uniref:hypothetical protein n=1 Tax=Streptomyces sp. WAC05374 TaxID=2487420 RepID=UPI000F872E82|nr:hypothetical protein [Streptomyces sp. WAC05374]RST16534.1 hypothetical protein EF905_12035 [Streptomyces sp. WAC05374]TDF54639.1 hypothetical protein E2C00_17100 [Streptomyces sp. WAC05374]TDF56274.1 hypothetical protein E2C02_12555 [Streptomyces sp. WAC05374]